MEASKGTGRKLVLCVCLSQCLFAAGCREEREASSTDREVMSTDTEAVSTDREASSTEESFRSFLDVYVERVDARDVAYLREVHPDLPEEMHDFFLDATTDMMQHSRAEGLEPEIECREYDVCKVVWTQPGGSWAAQRFILHEEDWRFLAE